MIITCPCGCTNTFEETVGKGQKKQYYTAACRQRMKRNRETIHDSRDIAVTEKIVDLQSSKIKPVLKYPGSKMLIAQWIVSNLPPHKIYVEPYFGSGAVFLNKMPSGYEVINDLDDQVVNLFRVIRNQGEALCDLIEMTPYARTEYYTALNHVPTGDALEDARLFLVRCWMAHGAKTSDRTGWMNRGSKAGGSTTTRWNDLPSRIRRVMKRMKDPEIENVPALDLIGRFKDAEDCLIYCDPPYVLATRGKRKMYKHEMTDADHVDLLDALKQHAGPVVLSGYAHPLYDEMLSDWCRLEMTALAEKGKERTEILWIKADAAYLATLKSREQRQMNLFEEVV